MARRGKGVPVHGWLNLDKPVGITSTQAVGRVRRLFNAQKAGHGGTLDPLASGILPIALGEATKTMPFLVGAQKEYRFTLEWGSARTTDDAEGQVTATSEVRPDTAQIQAALPRFIGEITQTPPIFSALKVAGARAYDLARAGEAVDLKPRQVAVQNFQLCGRRGPDHAEFEVVCGKGVYVRALARDLALHLGTCGHVVQLRRTRVGVFDEARSMGLDKLDELGHSGAAFEHLHPVETVLDDIPALAVTGLEANRLRQGQAISLTRRQADQVRGHITAYAAQGAQAICLGEIRAGQFCPTRVFNLPRKGCVDVD